MKNSLRLGMLLPMDRYFQCALVAAASLLLVACGTLRSSVVVEPASGAYSQTGSTPGGAPPARTPIPGGSYVVLKGDTLYSIAFRSGVDFRDLAQWNQIAEPYTIWPGQRLQLAPHKPAAPATGTVASTPAGVTQPPVFEPVQSAPTAPVTSQTPPLTSPVAAASAGVVPVAGVPAPATPAVAPVAAIPTAASRAVGGLTWRWPADGKVVKRFQSSDAIPGIEIAGNAGDPVRAAADGVVVYSGNGLVGYGELVIVKHSDSLLSAYGHNSKRLVKEGQRVKAGQQIAEMGSTGASRNGLEFQIRRDGNPVDPLTYLPPR